MADFGQAKAKIESTKLIGPAYIILSGLKPGEGVVITKGKRPGLIQPDGETIGRHG
jgi:hypothetical protein